MTNLIGCFLVCLLITHSLQQPAPSPSPCAVRIQLVVDTSGTNADAFERARSLLIRSIRDLDQTQLQVGIVLFDNWGKLLRPIAPADDLLYEQLDWMSLTGGGSSAVNGLEMAMQQLDTLPADQGGSTTLVLVADGNSGPFDTYDRVAQTAERLRNTKANVLALSFEPRPYLPELQQYVAEENDNIFVHNRQHAFQWALSAASRLRCATLQTLGLANNVIAEPPNACKANLVLIWDQLVLGNMVQTIELHREVLSSAIRSFRSTTSSSSVSEESEDLRVRVSLIIIDLNGEVSVAKALSDDTQVTAQELIRSIRSRRLAPVTTSSSGRVRLIAPALAAAYSQLNSTDPDATRRTAVMYIGNARSKDTHTALWTASRQLRQHGDTTIFGVTIDATQLDLVNMRTMTGIATRVYVHEAKSVNSLSADMHRPLSELIPDWYSYINDVVSCRPKRVTHAFCDIDLLIIVQSNGLSEQDFQDNKDMITQVIEQVSAQDFESERISTALFSTEPRNHMPFVIWKRKRDILSAVSTIAYGGWSPAPSMVNSTKLATQELFRARRKRSLLLVAYLGTGAFAHETYAQIHSASRIWQVANNTVVYAASSSPDAYVPGLIAITGHAQRVFTDKIQNNAAIEGKQPSARDQFQTNMLKLLNIPQCVHSRPVLTAGGVRSRA